MPFTNENKLDEIDHTQLKNLQSEYVKLGCIVFIIMLICSIGLSLIVYRQCQQKNQKIAENASIEIQKTIEQTLHDVSHIMKYVGTRISREPSDNLAKIAEHLISVREVHGSSSSWTALGWVDKINRLVASSQWGIMNPPREIVDRQYLIDAPNNPWKLTLCKPAWGVPSSVIWIIPVGMGITNSNEQFHGIVITGIDINVVTQKIRQCSNLIGINFIVFDESQNIIFQSLNKKKSRGGHLGQKLFSHFECHKSHQSHNLHYCVEKTLFYDYRKTDGFPFYIFTGIDKHLVYNDLYISLLPILVQLFGFGFLSIAILAFFWKKQIYPIVQLSQLTQHIKSGVTSFKIPRSSTVEMHQIMQVIEQERSMYEETERIKNLLSDTNIQMQKSYEELNAKNNALLRLQEEWSAFIQLIKNSDHEKEKFLRCLNHELEESMNEIINVLHVLLKTNGTSFDIPITSETAFVLLEKIYHELQNLKKLTSRNLKLSKIDIKQSIESCISVHAKTAFIRNIKIHFKTELLVPEFNLDKTRWQQIVVGLLSRALQFTPDQGQIQISVSSNNDALILIIQDEGLGLTESDLQRLENLFLSESLKFYDLTSLSLSTIEELIKLHGGFMKIESKWKEGTTVMITIPCIEEQLINESQGVEEFANLFDA